MPPPPESLSSRLKTQPDSDWPGHVVGTPVSPRDSQGLSPRRTVRERELRSCGHGPGMLGREGRGRGRPSGFRPRALQPLRGLLGFPRPPG